MYQAAPTGCAAFLKKSFSRIGIGSWRPFADTSEKLGSDYLKHIKSGMSKRYPTVILQDVNLNDDDLLTMIPHLLGVRRLDISKNRNLTMRSLGPLMEAIAPSIADLTIFDNQRGNNAIEVLNSYDPTELKHLTASNVDASTLESLLSLEKLVSLNLKESRSLGHSDLLHIIEVSRSLKYLTTPPLFDRWYNFQTFYGASASTRMARRLIKAGAEKQIEVEIGDAYWNVSFDPNFMVVMDGDTLEVYVNDKSTAPRGNPQKIRIFGVDTAEMSDRGGQSRPRVEKIMSIAARNLVAEQLAKCGRKLELVDLRSDGSRNGGSDTRLEFRAVATVYVCGKNLAHALLSSGLAYPYFGGNKTDTMAAIDFTWEKSYRKNKELIDRYFKMNPSPEDLSLIR
jgi:hypothetical protein